MNIPNFFFTTRQALNRYKEGSIEEVFTGSHNFYGMSWDNNFFYLADPEKIFKFSTFKEKPEILNYSRSKDIHQILYHKKYLYIMNTNMNCLDIFDLEKNEMHYTLEWTKSDIHPNSVFIHRNKIYICEHGNGSFSTIKSFHIETYMKQDIYENVGSMNHNIGIYNNKLYTLNSQKGCIVMVDLISGEKNNIYIEATNLPEEYKFFRGLTFNGQYFLLGANFKNLEHSKRDDVFSWIIVLDKNLKFISKIQSPKESQIKSVRFFDNGKFHNYLNVPKVFRE